MKHPRPRSQCIGVLIAITANVFSFPFMASSIAAEEAGDMHRSADHRGSSEVRALPEGPVDVEEALSILKKHFSLYITLDTKQQDDYQAQFKIAMPGTVSHITSFAVKSIPEAGNEIRSWQEYRDFNSRFEEQFRLDVGRQLVSRPYWTQDIALSGEISKLRGQKPSGGKTVVTFEEALYFGKIKDPVYAVKYFERYDIAEGLEEKITGFGELVRGEKPEARYRLDYVNVACEVSYLDLGGKRKDSVAFTAFMYRLRLDSGQDTGWLLPLFQPLPSFTLPLTDNRQ